jgi:hypothetical protein
MKESWKHSYLDADCLKLGIPKCSRNKGSANGRCRWQVVVGRSLSVREIPATSANPLCTLRLEAFLTYAFDEALAKRDTMAQRP